MLQSDWVAGLEDFSNSSCLFVLPASAFSHKPSSLHHRAFKTNYSRSEIDPKGSLKIDRSIVQKSMMTMMITTTMLLLLLMMMVMMVMMMTMMMMVILLQVYSGVSGWGTQGDPIQ